MKRQEICEKTGLTPKALRLYEEKGLITPDKSGVHYRTREYSKEDLERLQIIATLRKAMFTITEIKEMLERPESIQTIFPKYLDWLRQQSRQINDLLLASEQVDLKAIVTAGDLTEQIQSAADSLPIPASDIHFRFRQLDEMEEKRPDVQLQGGKNMRFNDITGGSDMISQEHKDRMYRQFVADSSKDYTDNLAVAMGQWDEAMGLTEKSRKRREKNREHLSLAALLGIFVLGALFVSLLVYGVTHPDNRNFSTLAPKGGAENVYPVLGDLEEYGAYTEQEIAEAAEFILETFPEEFQGCSLHSLAFAKTTDRVDGGWVQFTGVITSGRYLSSNLGIEKKNQDYNVRWTLIPLNEGWDVQRIHCREKPTEGA